MLRNLSLFPVSLSFPPIPIYPVTLRAIVFLSNHMLVSGNGQEVRDNVEEGRLAGAVLEPLSRTRITQ